MTEPKNAENWAKPIETFQMEDALDDAPIGNIEGRRPIGPLQGFGQLWQKTYEVRIPGVKPETVIATWKERFGEFWYPSQTFYPPPGGMFPGQVAVVGGGKGPTRVTTGVRIIYSDDLSWSYMNPDGHPYAGIITFSSHQVNDEITAVRVHLLVRANDPLYEMGFKIYTSRLEDKIWIHTLRQVASHFGVADPTVETTMVLVDKKRQWGAFWNIWKNAAVRTLLRRDRRRS